VSIIDRSSLRLDGELAIGGQEHFYLETQAAIAWIDETEVLRLSLRLSIRLKRRRSSRAFLGLHRHQVTVECLRMGARLAGRRFRRTPGPRSPPSARGRPAARCVCG